MNIPELSRAVENTLMAFRENTENTEDTEAYLGQCRFTTYFIVEMAKRWAERKYQAKLLNREVTIEETVEKSMDETIKHFRRIERKQARTQLKSALHDADDLTSYLKAGSPPTAPAFEEPPVPDPAPMEPVAHPEPNKEPPPPSTEPKVVRPPTAETYEEEPGGHASYQPLTPEEFAELKKRR